MWMVVRHMENIKRSLSGKVEEIKTSAESSFADLIGPAEVHTRAERRGGLLRLIFGKELSDSERKATWDEFKVTQTQAYG